MTCCIYALSLYPESVMSGFGTERTDVQAWVRYEREAEAIFSVRQALEMCKSPAK